MARPPSKTSLKALCFALLLAWPSFLAAAPVPPGPQDKAANEALAKAVSFYQAGNLPAAKTQFQRALKLRPGDKKAADYLKRIDDKVRRAALSMMTAAQKTSAQGERGLAKALSALPENPELLDQAFQQMIVRLEPGDEKALRDLDWLLAAPVSEPKGEKAADLQRRLRVQKRLRERLAQERARRRFQAGMALYKRGDWARAGKAFKEVLALKPGDPDARRMLGKIKSSAVEEKSERVDNLYQQAADLYANEDYARAGELLRQLLRLDPDHSDARRYLEKIDSLQGGRETP